MSIQPLKITTISCIFNTNIDITSIDLLCLGMFLELSSILIGLDINYMRNTRIVKRGITKEKKTNFYNQLTMTMNINNEIRKVKHTQT